MPVTVSRCRPHNAPAEMTPGKQKSLQLAVLLYCLYICQAPGMAADLAQASAPENTPGAAAIRLLDSDSGLAIDENWELVKAHCSACHSPRLVTQNRGSRQTWLSMIRWMQESQGLWAFDAATETAILDYLEKNYPPTAAYRRAPIKRELLPLNPYGTAN